MSLIPIPTSSILFLASLEYKSCHKRLTKETPVYAVAVNTTAGLKANCSIWNSTNMFICFRTNNINISCMEF